MILNFSSDVPIYLQIAQSIEDDILKGIFKEETQIPSTTEISLNYKVNPATVAKGYSLLTDSGIIYKKRGVGMFVSEGAMEVLLQKRRGIFYETYVLRLLEEARRLDIGIDDIISMMEECKGK
jgi:DNA-binding transcriptional regulator YhcF (GntR family)